MTQVLEQTRGGTSAGWAETDTGPRISVITVARNEEQDLPGFLQSFLAWADEIVIVDDGSSDRTCELAEQAGSRVKLVRSPRAAGEGFCHQRNKGIQAATGDWLLHVDVDMRTPRSFAREVRAAVRDPNVDAYEFGMVHFFVNRRMRYGGTQRWSKRWLVRKGCGAFERIVHEQMKLVDGARVQRLQERIWHLGDADFLERLRKNVLYSELEVARLVEQGASASLAGACWGAVRAFLVTYLAQGGFRDGRTGLFWALYVWSSTLNRGLLAYERLNPASRAEIERWLLESEA